jgi:hypothetical protein
MFARDLDQHAPVADVASLDKIGLEQSIGDFGLHAGRRRPADEPMGVERVGRALDLIEGEGDADLGAQARQVLVRGLEPAALAELFLHVLGAVEAALGDGRIELIGPPAHHDRPGVFRERFFEAFLAEVAPGAYDIADHVDGENLIRFAHGTGSCLRRFIWSRRSASASERPNRSEILLAASCFASYDPNPVNECRP